MDVPLAAGALQGLVAQHGALSAGAAHRQLHGQDRRAHQNEKQQIEQDEHTAAVLPCDIWKFPDIPDADGTPRADQ